jgi:hypothetical protein
MTKIPGRSASDIALIEALEEFYDQNRLSPWETDFYENVSSGNYPLSTAQRDTIEEILSRRDHRGARR